MPLYVARRTDWGGTRTDNRSRPQAELMTATALPLSYPAVRRIHPSRRVRRPGSPHDSAAGDAAHIDPRPLSRHRKRSGCKRGKAGNRPQVAPEISPRKVQIAVSPAVTLPHPIWRPRVLGRWPKSKPLPRCRFTHAAVVACRPLSSFVGSFAAFRPSPRRMLDLFASGSAIARSSGLVIGENFKSRPGGRFAHATPRTQTPERERSRPRFRPASSRCFGVDCRSFRRRCAQCSHRN